MDYWFIRVSPDGADHVAGGSTRLQEDGVDLGDGRAPRYTDADTIYYARHSDGAFMRWDRGRTSVVVRPQGFNFYEVAPDGRWMGYRPDPPRLIWWNDVPWPGWSVGAISNTRWAAIQYENSALWAGLGNGAFGVLVDPRPCSDVRLLGDILVWRTSGDIFAQREHGGLVENWSIEREDHFWPVPVWVGNKLYVLTHTQDRLLLYEARENQTHGVVVNQGVSDFPDIGALDDKRVRVVWTDKGVKHERVINLAEEPEVDLRTPIEEPPLLDTTGNSIDPLIYCFGELGLRDGDHYMCVHIDSVARRWYEIKFGDPDHWEGFYWGENFIGLWEDRSQSEPHYNPPWDYSMTEDVIMTRPMKPGLKIPHDKNEWIRFHPVTKKIIDRGPSPYHTWIGRVYKSYPFGGAVGNRPGFELNSHADGVPTLERHIFALNVGRCIWQVVHVESDIVQFQTKFVLAGGPRLTPTLGGRDANIANWPPKKTVVGMTITSFEEVVNVPRSRAVCNPNPNEEWAQEITWHYRIEGTSTWLQQDGPRDPRKDNDHTFRFPGPGRYEIRLRWESGQTEKKRVVTVR